MDSKLIDIRIENHKAFSEYLRFLVTLSTGSIVVLTSFIEKLAAQPKYGALIVVSLVAFLVSIISCVLAYTVITFYLGVNVGEKATRILVVTLPSAWISFLVALIGLTIFGITNLF